MSEVEIIQSLSFSAPMFSALFCAVLCLLYYFSFKKVQRRSYILLITAAFLSGTFCWLGAILCVIDLNAIMKYYIFILLVLMLDQVLLYHFVFRITRTEGNSNISPLHYILPIILCAIFAIAVWQVPPLFSTLFLSLVAIVWLYSIFYVLLGFRRLKNFHREIVNYSADAERISLKWIHILMLLILLSRIIPIVSLTSNHGSFFSYFFMVIGALVPIIQYAMITYNLISDNYVIIETMSEVEIASATNFQTLDRKKFERYMSDNKPYLNPKLRITDVATDFNTNRSYMSAFINRQYNMNFSRYINRLRLEELDRLRTSPQNSRTGNLELVHSAGFSSYRSYLRVKNEEDRFKLLKVF